MALRYEGVVDLRRYPINDPARQEYLDLVTDCRDQLHDQGVAQLLSGSGPLRLGADVPGGSALATAQ